MLELDSPNQSFISYDCSKKSFLQRKPIDNSSLSNDTTRSSPNISANSSFINEVTPVSIHYNRRNSSPLQTINSLNHHLNHSSPNINTHSNHYEYFKKSSKTVRSKLDLIDDTQLTSLPLPPPPSSNFNSVKSNSNDSLIESEIENEFEENDDPIILIEDYIHDDNNLMHKIEKKKSLATFKKKLMHKEQLASPSMIRQCDINDQSSVSNISTISTYNSKLSEISEMGEQTSDCETNIDMNNSSNQSFLNQSNGSPDCSVKSMITITPNAKQIENQTKHSNFKNKENLEEIFGKVPGMDKLKYCDLCDKPLYELSSLIDNDKFTEFICHDCTETYEGFFNELNNQSTNLEKIDLNSADQELDIELHLKFIRQLQQRKSTDSLNLTSEKKRAYIFDYDNSPETPSKKIKLNYNKNKFSPNASPKKFSKNLIKKLTSLQQDQFGIVTPPSASSPYEFKKNLDSKALELWNVTRKKLRWRWRLKGLLPQLDTNTFNHAGLSNNGDNS